MPEELTAIAEPEVPETVEETPEQVEGEEPAPSEEQEPEQREEVAADGRVIPQKYRELFKQDKELKDLFFQNREFKAVFPGGVTEAKQMLDYISEKGGREAIESIAAQLEESKQIDQMLTAGDAKIFDHVEQIAPGAVAKLAPEVLNRWNASDPEGCNAMLCGVVANSINNSGIPQMLFEASTAIKYGTPEVALQAASELIQKMTAQINSFGERAAAPVSQRAPQNDQLSQREKALAEKETAQFTQNLDVRVENEIAPRMFKEAVDLGYKDLTDRQKGLLYQETVNELNKVLGKDFQDKFAQAKTKRDLEGAMRLVSSRAPASLPEIVKRVTRELFGSPVGRVVKPAPPTPIPQRPAAPKPVAGRPGNAFESKLADIFSR